MDVLATVQKLMTLADSPFEEEARTAAIKAVRLIREHNLLPSCVEANEGPEDLQSLVQSYISSLMEHLRSQERISFYPYYTSASIADEMSVVYKTINRAELLFCIRKELKSYVKSGNLVYKPGKGYRLPYRFV